MAEALMPTSSIKKARTFTRSSRLYPWLGLPRRVRPENQRRQRCGATAGCSARRLSDQLGPDRPYFLSLLK
jgi:hypothetical protein